MINNTLTIGDVLRTAKGKTFDIMHYAIVFGWIRGVFYVAENNPGTGVALVPYSDFINRYGQQNLEVIKKNLSLGQQKSVRQRVWSVLGKTYNILQFNCEGFVNWVLNGKPISIQVRKAVGAVTLLTGIFVIASLMKGGSKNGKR